MITRMWRFGTVCCLHCSTVAANIADGQLELAPGTRPAATLRALRCPRCQGPTYIEREIEPSGLAEFMPVARR